MLAIMLVGFGCGTPGQAAPSSSTASTPSAAASQARCKALAGRGVTPCPPATLPLDQPEVVNHSGGAISDTATRKWADGLRRGYAYETWAVNHLSDSLLISGALSDATAARTNVFRDDLQEIDKARSSNSTLVFQAFRLHRLTLVPMPAALQAIARGQGLPVKPWAFVQETVGPGQVTMRGADGKETVLTSSPANVGVLLLIWGEYREDPQLGGLWYLDGYYTCSDPKVASTCSSA
jgi:hypothetical protein